MTTSDPRRCVIGAALALLPAGVAAAWVPLRTDLPSTDAALLLVVAVAAVATWAGRVSSLVAAITAVVAFDYFDTAPYGRLLIARTGDIVTAAVLLAAGLVIGSVAASRRRYRRDALKGQEYFTVMASTARLVSHGEENAIVLGALAGELVSHLDLLDSEFVPRSPSADRPYITRDGQLRGVGPGMEVTAIDLPVWVGDQAIAHYRLVLRRPGIPSPDRLRAAAGLAEQAGATLAGWPRGGPDPASPRRPRLVR